MTVNDDLLRDVLTSRADRARSEGLDALLAGALAERRHNPTPLRQAPGRLVAIGLIAVVAVALVAASLGPLSGLLEVAPLPSRSPLPTTAATATPAPTAPATPTPAPTDLALTPPPYVPGTCPVTPVTDLAGGQAPEVAASGIRWLWGDEPWQAGIGQKVVLRSGTGPETYPDVDVIAAARLPFGSPSSPLSVRYPKGDGPGFVFGIGLPEPGCWLLTAVGAMVRSSVVVEAGPKPANAPSPESQNVPVVTVPLTPLAVCPTSPVDMSNGYRRFVDQSRFWGDPDPASWMAGKERKLVVGASTDPVIAVASEVGSVSAGGPSQSPAFVTEPPVLATPPPGSGSIGVGFTIPRAGCWSFAFIEGSGTSTVVAEVGPAPTPSGG